MLAVTHEHAMPNGGNMDTHDWHLFDIDAGLEVRQVTGAGEANRWELRHVDADGAQVGEITVLSDDEFNQLRETGPSPKGL